MNFKRNQFKILLIIVFIIGVYISCKNENHIDKYDVDIETLKLLPDNFYAYRGGRIYFTDLKDNYRIWFELNIFGNIKNIAEIQDLKNKNNIKSQTICKYSIDTVIAKTVAQKIVDLSGEFKFGHINIDKKNKIAFSYKDGLPEQYVKTFNDSLKTVYLNNKEFKLLENGWFENNEK